MNVVQIGLGPIGLGVAQIVLGRGGINLIGAVDLDPAKIGHDVGALAGGEECGVAVSGDLDKILNHDTDVAIVTTSSRLVDVADTLRHCIDAGRHVVSTCEELAYPWRTAPDLAARIDAQAQSAGVAILGTGVNPGFLMDILPALLSGVCSEVRGIRVERFQDAGTRRQSFQAKLGVGLNLDEFHRRQQAGQIGHVGFAESIHLIADSLGLGVVRVTESIEPVPAAASSNGADSDRVLGLKQLAIGYRNDEPIIELELQAYVGHPNPRDTVTIRGTPDVTWSAPGGINGDIATCAMTVNALPVVMGARSGLRTMRDIPAVTWFQSSD